MVSYYAWWSPSSFDQISVASKFDTLMRKIVGKCPTQKCINVATKFVSLCENAQHRSNIIKQSLSKKKPSPLVFDLLVLFCFHSHLITTAVQIIKWTASALCNILISLLPESKPLKIASKLGFLAPGLEKWTKVVQAWILVKNGPPT